MLPNWLTELGNLTPEDIRLIQEGKELAIEWAKDGVYPCPDNSEKAESEFFHKYTRKEE